MKLGTSFNEENGQENYSYLTFETGKKILLSTEEKEELMEWSRNRVEPPLPKGGGFLEKSSNFR